ncbi:hypothetical protein glysoja_047388 [Glycine soja]|uniref:Uncharacterized protein n=1 Tax=Glycine soja TaxID=3848 RepID=A0A0B2QPI1_GLYSO|nr:hypothetical protein glysoja_047388 [Glycine soja]
MVLCQSYRVPVPPARSCHHDIGIAPTRHPVDPEKSNKALGFPALVTGLCQSYRVPVPPSKGLRPQDTQWTRRSPTGSWVSSSDYRPLSVLRSVCRPQQGDQATY